MEIEMTHRRPSSHIDVVGTPETRHTRAPQHETRGKNTPLRRKTNTDDTKESSQNTTDVDGKHTGSAECAESDPHSRREEGDPSQPGEGDDAHHDLEAGALKRGALSLCVLLCAQTTTRGKKNMRLRRKTNNDTNELSVSTTDLDDLGGAEINGSANASKAIGIRAKESHAK